MKHNKKARLPVRAARKVTLVAFAVKCRGEITRSSDYEVTAYDIFEKVEEANDRVNEYRYPRGPKYEVVRVEIREARPARPRRART